MMGVLVLVLVGAGIALKYTLREACYLWFVREGDAKETGLAAEGLGEISSARAVPLFAEAARRSRCLVCHESVDMSDGPCSQDKDQAECSSCHSPCNGERFLQWSNLEDLGSERPSLYGSTRCTLVRIGRAALPELLRCLEDQDLKFRLSA